MNSMKEFKIAFPKQTSNILEKTFQFRYFKNENSDITVVLLVGGIGLSDLMAKHFESFSKHYSVISFDYSIEYPNIQILTDAIAELMRTLNIKAYFIGQSLGGFIAQIVTKNHPDVVEGFILSNTGTLSSELGEDGSKCLHDMLKRVNKSLFLYKVIPFGIIKKQIKKAVLNKTSDRLSRNEKKIMEELCEEMILSLTKKYMIHMSFLLKDLQNHWNLERTDFEHLDNKVLLILSDDDHTFNDNVKDTLISIMPDPLVVTDIRGGHLALMLKFDAYRQAILDFIDSSNEAAISR